MFNSIISRLNSEENPNPNSPDIFAAYLARTNGKIITRFPPEPNGYLHIGHAKAIHLSFGLAKERNGECILRYDDTNSLKECEEFVKAIEHDVHWLGYTPHKITYCSDYFDDLFNIACELIKEGYAYVCHQSREEASKYREERKESPWRDRPAEESLKIFFEMKNGIYGANEAVLRLKMPKDRWNNPCMRDIVAYRIIFNEHIRTQAKWCIYPTYDFSHCIVDSLEDITYSFCTLEFMIRHESYVWLLKTLNMYIPTVYEFSRLVLGNCLTSKRSINELIKGGSTKLIRRDSVLLNPLNKVSGWDDPSLATIAGLRMRGFTPESINTFCDLIGITQVSGTVIPYSLLEQCLRDDLDSRAHRRFAVLRPLKVIIDNWPEGYIENIVAPNHPKQSFGTRVMPLTRVIYIEQDDFRPEYVPKLFKLMPNNDITLKYAYVIRLKEIFFEEGLTKVEHITAEIVSFDKSNKKKTKGVIHWVAEPQPGINPFTDKFMLINDKGNKEIINGFVEPTCYTDSAGFGEAKSLNKYQFERLGYYSKYNNLYIQTTELKKGFKNP